MTASTSRQVADASVDAVCALDPLLATTLGRTLAREHCGGSAELLDGELVRSLGMPGQAVSYQCGALSCPVRAGRARPACREGSLDTGSRSSSQRASVAARAVVSCRRPRRRSGPLGGR